MMREFGISYRTAGENIAMGYQSAQSVVNGWMNSPGHRANILNPSFEQLALEHIRQAEVPSTGPKCSQTNIMIKDLFYRSYYFS